MKTFITISPRKDVVDTIQSSLSKDAPHYTFDNIESALAIFHEQMADVLFFDANILSHKLDQSSLLQEFNQFRKINPSLGIVALASKADVQHAVRLVKAGANDYLTYPIDPAEISLMIESLEKSLVHDLELDYLRDRFWKTEWLDRIHTRTERMRDVYKKIRAVAATKATVMLSGETGTGKSLLARLLHIHSGRAEDPFIAVHCGAIPDTLLESELFGHEKGAFTGAVRMKKGKFELARNGTIFLDEISTISPAAQVKLLQVLQDGTFNRVGGESELKTDARIIAATNTDLNAMSEQGNFRKDLFYRLNVFPIDLPALRERKEDIPILIEQLLKKLNTVYGKELDGIHSQAISGLKAYDWPGNIRELENVLERAYILESTKMLTPENFPVELFDSDDTAAMLPINTHKSLSEARQLAVEDFERHYLKELFLRTKGKVSLAAEEAGISTRQLNKLMNKHGIRKEAFKK